MYHTITVVGNLGRDPELRHTPDGKPVTNLSVATNRKWTNADGTPGEETVWFRVACWGKLAEVCSEYLPSRLLGQAGRGLQRVPVQRTASLGRGTAAA
jgi:single stranded DNA-binding protein